MKKIKSFISYSFTLILYFLFILFTLIMASMANDNNIFFNISMILVAITMSVFAIILNKCAKIQLRIFYKITTLVISIQLIAFQFYYMFIDKLADNTVYYWIIHFLIAGSIAFYIFQLIFTFKDLFKKSYTLEKFDFQAFIMALNNLAYLLIVELMTFGNLFVSFEEHLDNITFEKSITVLYQFKNIAPFIGYISLGYTILYIVINIIFYHKFGKDERD